MHRLSLALLLVNALSSSCSPEPRPKYAGPPPEFEPPRSGPGGPTASASSAPADTKPEAPSYGSVEDLSASIDAYAKGFGARYGASYAPSGVLVVAHDGKVVLTRGYGRAKVPDGPGPTAQTRFRIGSVTKPIVATALMKLVEDKAVSLEDSVRKLVPELPAAYEDVKLDNVLSHTSGIPNYTAPGGLLARKMEEVSQKDVLAWMAQNPPAPAAPTDGKPRAFSYSNSNYYLVGVVIERATKLPLEQALAKLVLGPAGMRSTGVTPESADAVGYRRNGRDEIVAADVVSSSLPFGAGFLRSTAEDLVAFERALSGTAVLTEASKTRMWTPVSKDYAFGWIVGDVGGSKVIWHNGAIDGFGAFVGRAPEKKLSVVFLSNLFEFDATRLGLDVLKMAVTGSPVAAPVEREVVAIDEALGLSLAGEFVLDKKAKKELEGKLPAPVLASIEGMTLTYDKGALTAKPTGQGEFSLKRAPDGTLFHAELRIDIVVDPTAPKSNKAPGFTLKQGSVVAKYVRGKAPKPKK
jgi:CubicO group peptidase (beta-lactamase class C family)